MLAVAEYSQAITTTRVPFSRASVSQCASGILVVIQFMPQTTTRLAVLDGVQVELDGLLAGDHRVAGRQVGVPTSSCRSRAPPTALSGPTLRMCASSSAIEFAMRYMPKTRVMPSSGMPPRNFSTCVPTPCVASIVSSS